MWFKAVFAMSLRVIDSIDIVKVLCTLSWHAYDPIRDQLFQNLVNE